MTTRIKWDEAMVLRCSVEDKLPSELMQGEQTQAQGQPPANPWGMLKAKLLGTPKPPVAGV